MRCTIPGFEHTMDDLEDLCREAHELVERRKAKLEAEQEGQE